MFYVNFIIEIETEESSANSKKDLDERFFMIFKKEFPFPPKETDLFVINKNLVMPIKQLIWDLPGEHFPFAVLETITCNSNEDKTNMINQLTEARWREFNCHLPLFKTNF